MRSRLAEDALYDLFRRFLPRGNGIFLGRRGFEGPDKVAPDVREDTLHDPAQVTLDPVDDAPSVHEAAAGEIARPDADFSDIAFPEDGVVGHPADFQMKDELVGFVRDRRVVRFGQRALDDD